MPTRTPNLNMYRWLETDAVDFEQVNSNFTTIDNCVMCTESGTATASYTGGISGVATWRYKKFSDGTIEMTAKMEFDNLKCNGGPEVPYYSGTSHVYFPFAMSAVHDVQMHLASNTIGWVSNITGRSVIDKVMFRVMAMHYESEYEYKQVFISVKGVTA